MIIKISAILLLLQWTTKSMSIPTYDITREEKRSVGNSGSSHFEQSSSYKSSSSSHEVKAESSQTYYHTSHKSSEDASQVTVENHHKENGKFEHATSEESKYVVKGEYTQDKNTQNNKHFQKILIHENQHNDEGIQHKFQGSLSKTGKHFKDLTNGHSKVIKIREPNQFYQNIGQTGVKISVTQDEKEQKHSTEKETTIVINLSVPQTDGSIVVTQSGSENGEKIVSGKNTKKTQHTSFSQNKQTVRKGKMLEEHEKLEGNMNKIIERHGESHSGIKVATKEIHVQRNNHKESSHQTHAITNNQHHNSVKKNQRKVFLSETENTSKRERDLHQNIKEKHVESDHRVKINEDVINFHLNNQKEFSHQIHTITDIRDRQKLERKNYSKREENRHQEIIERHVGSNNRLKINEDQTRKESSQNTYVDLKSKNQHKQGTKIERQISRNENREISKGFKEMHSNRKKIEHHQDHNQNSEHHSYGRKEEKNLSFSTSKDTYKSSESTTDLTRKVENKNILKDLKNSHRHTLNGENGKDITITITGDIDQLTASNKASYHDMSSSRRQKQHIQKKESIGSEIENAASKHVTKAESIHQRKHDHIVDSRQVVNFLNNNNQHNKKQSTDIFIEDMGSNIEEKGRGSYHKSTSKSEEITHNTQSRKYTKLNEYSKKNDKEIVVVAADDLDSETNNLAKDSYYKTVSQSEGHQYHNREESAKQTIAGRHIGLDNGKDVTSTMTSYKTVAKSNSENKYKNQRSTSHYSDDEGDVIVTVLDSDTKNHRNQYHKQKENGYHRYKQQGNGVRHSEEDKTDVIVTVDEDIDTKVHENQYHKQESNEKYTSLIQTGKISTDSFSNLEVNNQHKNNQRRYTDKQKEIVAEDSYTHSKILDSDSLQELLKRRSKNSDDVTITEEQMGEYQNKGRRHMVKSKDQTRFNIKNSQDFGTDVTKEKAKDINYSVQVLPETKSKYNTNGGQITITLDDDLGSSTTKYLTKSKSIINPANSHSFTKSFEQIGGDTYHVDVDQDFSPHVGKIMVKAEKIVQPPTVIVEQSYGSLNNDGIDENAMSHSAIHSTANYLERSAKRITKHVVSGVHGEKYTGTGSGISNGDISGQEMYEVDDAIGTQLPGDRLKGNIHRNSKKGTLIKNVELDGDMQDTQEEWKMDPLEQNSKLRPTRSISFTLPEDNFSEFKSTSFQQSGKQFGQQQRTITVSGNSGQKYQIYQKSQPLVWSVQSSGQEVNGQGSGYIQQSYPDGNVKFSRVKWNSQGVNPGEQKFTFSQKISDNSDLLNDQFEKMIKELRSTSNAPNTIVMSKQVSGLDRFPLNLDFQSINDDLFFNDHFNIGNSHRNKVEAFEQMSTIGQPEIASKKIVNGNNILQSKVADQSDFDLSTLLDLMRQPSDQQSEKFLQISQHGSVQSEQPLELITKATSTQFGQQSPHVNTSPVLDLLTQPADQKPRKMLQTTEHRSFLTDQPTKVIIKASTKEFGQSIPQRQYFHITDQLKDINQFNVHNDENKGTDFQKNLKVEDLLDIFNKHSNQISNGLLQQTQRKSAFAQQPIQFMTVVTNHQTAQIIPQKQFTTTKLNGFDLQSEDTKDQGFQDQSNQKASEFKNSLQFGDKQFGQPSSEVVQQDSSVRLNNLQIDQPYSLLNKDTDDQSNQIIQQADDQKYVNHLYGLNQLFDKQPKMTKDLDLQEDLVGKRQQQISNDFLQQNSAVNNLLKKTTTHESSQQMQQSSEHKSRLVESDQPQYAEQPFSVWRRQTEETNHQSEKSKNMEHASSHTSLQIGDGSRPFEVVSTQTNHKVTKVEHSSKSEKRSTRRVTVQGPIQQVVGG
ncbi:uncharacterized protein [Diabrotica undecimpunctata]|uniref:uncharacterized protein n=1 Tax=Diabrotica undecimpunctata TaxID=50387 RepID=UPI003B63C2F3